MTGYVVRRVVVALVLVWVVITAVFFLINALPGDAVLAMAGQRPESMSQEQRDFVRHELGLDRPVYIRYVEFLGNAARGDFGTSLSSRRPVMVDVVARFPRTVELAVAALLVGLVVGIPAGVFSALHRNSWMDVTINGVLVVLGSTPIYISAIFLLLVFGLYLGWVPTGGFVPIGDNLGGHLRLLILPSLALGLWMGAVTARMTRHAMLEVLSQDYVRTAYSKGLADRKVHYGHAFKNAMIPMVTAVGLQVGDLLGGAVLTETVFTWPGVGSALVSAITRRDYPVVEGILILTVTAFIFTNLAVDLLVGYLDPRISRS